MPRWHLAPRHRTQSASGAVLYSSLYTKPAAPVFNVVAPSSSTPPIVPIVEQAHRQRSNTCMSIAARLRQYRASRQQQPNSDPTPSKPANVEILPNDPEPTDKNKTPLADVDRQTSAELTSAHTEAFSLIGDLGIDDDPLAWPTNPPLHSPVKKPPPPPDPAPPAVFDRRSSAAPFRTRTRRLSMRRRQTTTTDNEEMARRIEHFFADPVGANDDAFPNASDLPMPPADWLVGNR